MNILIYNLRMRIFCKRDEHHRCANDCDLAAKREHLYGRMASVIVWGGGTFVCHVMAASLSMCVCSTYCYISKESWPVRALS